LAVKEGQLWLRVGSRRWERLDPTVRDEFTPHVCALRPATPTHSPPSHSDVNERLTAPLSRGLALCQGSGAERLTPARRSEKCCNCGMKQTCRAVAHAFAQAHSPTHSVAGVGAVPANCPDGS
jgi:hypothetical protein